MDRLRRARGYTKGQDTKDPIKTTQSVEEIVARAIVRAKGAEVCASDEEWPLALAHHRAMEEEHGAAYAEGRSLYTDAFRFARAALAALTAKGYAVVPREADASQLEAARKYVVVRYGFRGKDDPNTEARAELYREMVRAYEG